MQRSHAHPSCVSRSARWASSSQSLSPMSNEYTLAHSVAGALHCHGGRCRDGPTDSLLPGVRCQTRQLGAQGFWFLFFSFLLPSRRAHAACKRRRTPRVCCGDHAHVHAHAHDEHCVENKARLAGQPGSEPRSPASWPKVGLKPLAVADPPPSAKPCCSPAINYKKRPRPPVTQASIGLWAAAGPILRPYAWGSRPNNAFWRWMASAWFRSRPGRARKTTKRPR